MVEWINEAQNGIQKWTVVIGVKNSADRPNG